ncbi:MAG: thiolase domain-containing protein [Nitrososphaerales archaeon]|nr:thiolase domain-containing protein [Nitrososphaerales archaeon]
MNVAVIGVGMTKFGRHEDKGTRELFVEAASKAIEDAKISPKDIQAAFIGCLSAEWWEHQSHLGSLYADWLGINTIPATRVESACASSGAALRCGVLAVASGLHDIVLVGGVEKMYSGPRKISDTAYTTEGLALAADEAYEQAQGLTFPGLYALIATAHMHKYGTKKEQLSKIAVKNHKNAAKNPLAHFQKEITLEEAMNARMIAYPLNLYDCCPISDGAAAAILCRADLARRFTDTLIYIIASAQASDTIALHNRQSYTSLRSARVAAQEAYKMAKIEPKDVDIAEVHDCFTIAELIAYEDLGFCKPGEGGKLIDEGEVEVGGRIPVNTDGGLKAKGHPVGATGVAMIHEIVKQLRGEAVNQVKAEIGLAHNVGGSGGSCTVHILKRVS